MGKMIRICFMITKNFSVANGPVVRGPPYCAAMKLIPNRLFQTEGIQSGNLGRERPRCIQ